MSRLRILGKAISVPEGSRSAFLRIPIRGSEHSDAGGLIVEEVIGIVKRRKRSAVEAARVRTGRVRRQQRRWFW